MNVVFQLAICLMMPTGQIECVKPATFPTFKECFEVGVKLTEQRYSVFDDPKKLDQWRAYSVQCNVREAEGTPS